MKAKYKSLLTLYGLITLIVFFIILFQFGALRAWLFGAFACAIPTLLDKSEK